MRSTLIYFLLSLVVALCGALTTALTGEAHPVGLAVATSVLAAGLASMAFSIVTYLQARDQEGTIARLDDLAAQLQRGLSSLRQAEVLADVANSRRIFDRHPDQEVQDAIDHASGDVRVDVMGLTLKPFCSQQVPLLKERPGTTVRVLIQDPTSHIFEAICRQESRDFLSSLEDAVSVTKSMTSHATDTSEDARIEIRWFLRYPSLTMTRVNELWFVRARFLREADKPRTFFECYTADEGTAYDTYQAYFEAAWTESRAADVAEADAALAAARERWSGDPALEAQTGRDALPARVMPRRSP